MDKLKEGESLMPIQVEITVGKKVSSEVAKNRWRTVRYELKTSMGAEDMAAVEAQKEELEAKIDEWLAVHTGKLTRPVEAPEGPIPLNDIPDLDLAELETAGWQTYQKNPCKPGQAGWVKNPVEFTSWKDPPQVLLRLVKAIHKTPEKELVLGDMVYFLKSKFINRKPIKQESAR